MNITINQAVCIHCGKCARVCPDSILTQESAGSAITVAHPEECVVCGHCVDVCPTGAVVHPAFPPATWHELDYAAMPSPESLLELLRARRSNRSFLAKPVPRETLERIVYAANLAPTATNSQALSYTLVTQPERLRQVSDYTVGVFNRLAALLLNPVVKCLLKPFMGEVYSLVPMFQRLRQEHEAGSDPILRKAPALLIIHTPSSNRFKHEDGNLAYQNASLMAQSLGISQVYMGFVLSAIRHDIHRGALARLLGIDGEIVAIMALGYPAFRYPRYVDRKPPRMRFME